jgi:PKD repeat protein
MQTANNAITRMVPENSGPKLRSINSLGIDTLASTQDIVNTLFGPGISVSNLIYTGDSLAVGFFKDITGTFGIDSGLVMTSGHISGVAGPNVSTSTTNVNNTPGDPDLTTLAGGFSPTYDAAVIEFDFTPMTDTLMLSFVFGSEEYPEFVNSNFNDVFAFWVSELTNPVPYNMAMVPGTISPISINTVNNITNPSFYIDNAGGQVLEADGLTTLITQMYMPSAGQDYHFKIGIADVADFSFDSYVFIKAKGLLGYAKMPTANCNTAVSGNTVSFTNTGGWARNFLWDFGDGTTDTAENPVHTYLQSGQYTVTLSAINFYQVNTITFPLTVGGASINENELQATLTIASSENGLYHLILNPLTSGSSTLNVFTTAGSLAYSQAFESGQKEVTLDLRSLPRGVYSIQLQNNGKQISRKLVR